MRHVMCRGEAGVLDKCGLPSHYKTLLSQFETTDSQVATLHNRGEAGVFDKIAQAVKQVHRRDFELDQLGDQLGSNKSCLP